MKRRKGSITLFSSISLLLVTAAIFALLEGTRLQELQRFSKLQTMAALESVFAEYNSCLWQNYHLLGASDMQMEGILEAQANARQEDGANFLRFEVQDIEIESYTRITDEEGTVYINCVSAYMRENVLYETIKEVYSQYEAIKQLLDTSELDAANIGDAIDEIKNLDKNKQKSSARIANKKGAEVLALLEAVEEWRRMGILGLVVKDTSKLSRQEMDFGNGLLKRELLKGNSEITDTVDWEDRVLLQLYLMSYMSNLQEEKAGRALSYELEYLLGKKSNDLENLNIVVAKLLAIREASNFLYLLSSPARVAEAKALAVAIGGASLNPIVIELIKVALLTAWALAESILDIRALLAGKRIALLKSEESWTLDLDNIGGISKDFAMAKESKWGLSYENYLGIILLLEDENSLAMRAMNVQEATIRKTYQDENFGMDTLIVQASVNVGYRYEPIFPFLRVVDAQERWEYELFGTADYGYY